MLEDSSCRHVHCIGLGGIGVSALAEILVRRGYTVSGSDVSSSDRLTHLSSIGVETFVGHQAEQITAADVVVYSSAVSEDNPELQLAREKGLRIMKRGELLADIMQASQGVAVAGTHGKTTTTAMLSHILKASGYDPTYFVGGIQLDQQSPVHIGSSDYFIAEADESDASFLYMKPKAAIVTNLEPDHLENYDHSEDALISSFMRFLQSIPDAGFAVLCGDDENLQACMEGLGCDAVTYGEGEDHDYVLKHVSQQGLKTMMTVEHHGQLRMLTLQVTGKHNALNAMAAWAVAERLGVPIDSITNALSTFPGVARRLQLHGKMLNDTVDVFEDYGHHPTELRVTIDALRAAFTERRLVMVFQPHRYSRTRDLFHDFIAVLKTVDVLCLLPTYAASEVELPEANSAALFSALAHPNAQLLKTNDMLQNCLSRLLQPNDVVVFQGAGDVGRLVKLSRGL